MKITIITSPFCELPPDAIGAVERRWANTAVEFARQGHRVELLGKKGRIILPSEGNLTRTYVRGYERTRSVYLDIGLDLVYSIRALWCMRPCDVLVCNTFWTPILAPILFGWKYKKLVYNVARFPKCHMRVYKGVDLFACTSSSVRVAFVNMFPRFADHAVVVSNPIDVGVFNVSGGRSSAVAGRIGYHGRVHVEKGLDILAEAIGRIAKECPQVSLRLVGPVDIARGGSGEAYRRKLDELSGGRIEWCPPVSDPKRLAELLRECESYCYPSVAEKGETFGVSPLEAMGLGLPVVVSKLECFSDFVRADENGLVFDHRSADRVQQLADKLRALCVDPSLRKRLSGAAATTASTFTVESIATRYVQEFEGLMK